MIQRLIRIFVAPAYGCTAPAHHLQKIFGESAQIYIETNHVCNDAKSDHSNRNAIAGVQVPFVNETEKDRFDIFFLSGLLVRDGVLNPSELKARFGNPCSSVVVMSIEDSYIQEIIDNNDKFNVDYFHFKVDFGLVDVDEKINPMEIGLIMSYVWNTFEKQQAEMFYACEFIRSEMFKQVLKEKFRTSVSTSSYLDTESDMGTRSGIHSLIDKRNWNALFESGIWVSLLKRASSIAETNNKLMRGLMLLQKFFPEKTEDCIHLAVNA